MLNSPFKRSFSVLILLTFLVGCQSGALQKSVSNNNVSKTKAKEALEELFERFSREDISGFMRLVSTKFQGNRLQLERDLNEQVRQVNAIDYEFFIDRTISGDDAVQVQFHWDRRWRVIDTGAEPLTEGSATFRFIPRDDELLLQDIRGNNPFLNPSML